MTPTDWCKAIIGALIAALLFWVIAVVLLAL